MIELMVVIAIIAVLIGLLLAAIMKAREAAVQLESANQVRQLVLALHGYADTHHGSLPLIPQHEQRGRVTLPIRSVRSLFVSILPYIEEGNQYQSALEKPMFAGPIALFLSPADPTAMGALGKSEAVSSYAANAQVFSYMNDPRLHTTFRDGTSSTIVFAEHYAFNCHGTSYYYAENVSFRGKFRRATFADLQDVRPVTSGSPPVSEPSFGQLTFQAGPAPNKCMADMAQTPHRSGMVVGVADGHVRTVTSNIAPTTFWGAVTPAGGEALGPDW
jgi:type II secretory pathway pseudopilin PulG